MLTLTFLGTSAALPSVGRHNVALTVQYDGKTFLIESGPSILNQLQMAGVEPCEIEHLFVSHRHGDHMLGFPMLMLHRFLNPCSEPIKVICPHSITENLRQVVASVYPEVFSRLEKDCHFIPQPTSAKHSTQIESKFSISTLPVVHSVPTLALRLDCFGKSIVYSADTAPLPTMAQFAAGCDVLIHDANFSATLEPDLKLVDHSTAKAAAEIARAARVEILVLIHINKRHAGRERLFYEEAASVFPGQIIVPTHLSTLVLT